MNRKKILVTGGNGLVGSAFRRIASNYPEYEFIFVTRDDCDLRCDQQVQKMVNLTQPNWIIHAAGKVGGVKYNSEFPDELFYDNIMMNTNLLHCARIFNVEKLVAFISTCSFPADVVNIEEDFLHLGPPHHTNTAYATAKRALDVQIQSYRKRYGLDYYSIIPSNLYGPNDNFDIEAGHVVGALINKCHRAVLENKDVVVWGDGSQVREFIFVDDLVRATMKILPEKHKYDKILISDSKPISIRTLAEHIAESCNLPRNRMIFDTSKPSGLHKRTIDTWRFRFLTNAFVFTEHQQGIDLTAQWYASKYPNVRGVS